MVTSNMENVASVVSTAAITRGHFVTAAAPAQGGQLQGTHSALNGKALGVSTEAASAAGEWLPVQIQGIAIMEAGEAILVGDDVGPIAGGFCGKTGVTNVLGVALEAAAINTFLRVRLVK